MPAQPTEPTVRVRRRRAVDFGKKDAPDLVSPPQAGVKKREAGRGHGGKDAAGPHPRSPVKKPLFVTTVRAAPYFDRPPPQHPSERPQERLYSFASRPRVIDNKRPPGNHVTGHRARCEAAAAAAAAAAAVSTINATQQHGNRSSRKDESAPNSEDGPLSYGNIMFDRRVVRGTTVNTQAQPKWNPYFGYAKLLSQEQRRIELEAARRRRAAARRRAKAPRRPQRLGTPPPVSGRQHMDVQTEKYLEEIFDRPKEEDVWCQTDPFIDRPPTPLYIPAKTGVDAETQIYPGDLFDFDVEVRPLLEVLVGKTIENSLIEVLEEEELAALRAQQRRFQELRAAELAEQQRLEEQERRLREEKERRVAQRRAALEAQKEAERRVAAAVLTRGYLIDLLPSVLEGLRESGDLPDDVEKETEESIVPWLADEVRQEMQQLITSRTIITDIVREILETRAELYKVLGDPSGADASASPGEDLEETPVEEEVAPPHAVEESMLVEEDEEEEESGSAGRVKTGEAATSFSGMGEFDCASDCLRNMESICKGSKVNSST
ncbi:radial spoke head protein 3 homolog B [Hetaerina americana]|uniref:radial spoke head protein 3 homolog B n=1 Tax=Hetaerina americana TaxID=62018 RepID=UPI003A7F3DCF